MTIIADSIRWADTASTDSVTGSANRVAPSEGIKTEGILREEPLSRPHLNYQFNSIHTAFVEVQNQIDNLVLGSGASLLGLIYHVGAIYISLDSQDPADKFGLGTWSRVEGRTLIGYDEDDTDFDGAGGTGGTKSHSHTQTLAVQGHVLTVAELPSHSHDVVQEDTRGLGSAGAEDGASGTKTTSTSTVGSNQAHSHSLTGSISASPLLPPYLTVYIWKRVS